MSDPRLRCASCERVADGVTRSGLPKCAEHGRDLTGWVRFADPPAASTSTTEPVAPAPSADKAQGAGAVIGRLRKALAACPDETPMVIEEHGDREALYLGRDGRHHGLNIVHLSEPAYQWPAVREALPVLWALAPALLDVAQAAEAYDALPAPKSEPWACVDGSCPEDCEHCADRIALASARLHARKALRSALARLAEVQS